MKKFQAKMATVIRYLDVKEVVKGVDFLLPSGGKLHVLSNGWFQVSHYGIAGDHDISAIYRVRHNLPPSLTMLSEDEKGLAQESKLRAIIAHKNRTNLPLYASKEAVGDYLYDNFGI